MGREHSYALVLSVSLYVLVTVCVWTINGAPAFMTRIQGKVPPMVFIPGSAGNQMEMKVDPDYLHLAPEKCADFPTDWVRAWLDIWNFLPNNVECWVYFTKLVFNNDTKEFEHMPGVEFRIPGWESTDTIEYVDPSTAAYLLGDVGVYAAPLIEEMVKWGYQKGWNLRAAPYDFRFGPSQGEYYDRLKHHIEKLYHDNDRHKVILFAHSMGGHVGKFFIQMQDQEWKDKYIDSFVTLNTPWKGTMETLNALISGYNWGHSFLDPILLRDIQRNAESTIFLLPSSTEWSQEEVLVETPERNYTVHDFDELFDDMGFPLGQDMVKSVRNTTAEAHFNPGVHSFCMYSSGHPTPLSLIYDDGFPHEQPETTVYGDGDGTVNLRSAKACENWEEGSDFIVHTQELKGVHHVGAFKSKHFHGYLYDFILSRMHDDCNHKTHKH